MTLDCVEPANRLHRHASNQNLSINMTATMFQLFLLVSTTSSKHQIGVKLMFGIFDSKGYLLLTLLCVDPYCILCVGCRCSSYLLQRKVTCVSVQEPIKTY